MNNHKEWISSRIASLKKQAGFTFNNDLFISILLCLISSTEKHLILTGPSHRLQDISQMATTICRSLFGFSTANVTCQAQQTQPEFVHSLFAASLTRDEQERPKTAVLSPSEIEEMYPVSPIDFNVSTRHHHRFTTTDPGSDLLARPSGKLAQSVIIRGLEEADELVQATLLELIVAKELRISNVRYTVPKPYFLVIMILPRIHQISSQLLDRFFISYDFAEQAFISSNHRIPRRRMALMKNEELKVLAEMASRVYINIDIKRYIRDIIVGIRAHPLVHGGLTSRASQDLLCATRSLATLFRQDYLTPELVSIAADKVLGHRIRLEKGKEGSAKVIAEVLRVVNVPV